MSKIFGKIIHEGVLLSVCVFFVQTNHTRKELLFLMFKEINLRNHSSLHKLFYSLNFYSTLNVYTLIRRIIYDLQSFVSKRQDCQSS
ncbi:hypothetical protein CEE94_04930 [Lactobacillus crispatus]|nr:hypothetical protein CEE94_04930 [Lactobacillus crispatus]